MTARLTLVVALIAFGLLSLPLVATAQKVQPPKGEPASISGHVTVQGKLAPNVEVALLPPDSWAFDKPIATTKTDANGRYQFTNLQADRYYLRVRAEGYVNSERGAWQGQGRNITVASGETVDDADLAVVLGGTLSGRITDSDGNPVVGEPVELSSLDDYGPRARAIYFASGPFKTDADGRFNIVGIASGTHLVSIGVDIARLRGDIYDKNDWDGPFGRVTGGRYYEQTFYPGVTDRQKAHRVSVSTGEAVNAINITVAKSLPTYTVSGRVVDTQTGKGLANARLQLMQRFGKGGFRGATSGGFQADQTDEDGNFRLTGLIPGSFFMGASLIESQSDLYSSKVDFEIKDGDVSGLVVKVFHGLTLEGTVVVEGEAKDAMAKLPTLEISAILFTAEEDVTDRYRFGRVGTDGRFKVSGLRRGDVQLSLAPHGESQYFSIARVEMPKPDDKSQMQTVPVGAFGQMRLALTDKDLNGIRVVLAYKNASIKGHVTVTGGRLPENIKLMARVHHLSSDKRTDSSSMVTCDANGNFSLEGLEPGDYEVAICDGRINFTEMRTVQVKKGAATEVSFTVNVANIKER
jgi:uncharacterized surface anchored protein